ncbi:MAG: tetratricopeptide repeat protein, partial [Candidatus Omnitrophica bacterium]|nr:tetratricopeptide repeat protein [Candidatus Omnitrophota bacterium]
CSVGIGTITPSCLSTSEKSSSARTDSVGNRIREICIPTVCLLMAWYTFQTGLHIIKSNDTDRFFRYHLKNPKGWNLLYAYANYLQSEGRTEEAEPFVIESTRVHPTSLTLNALGVSRAKKGKPEEGLDVFLDILEFDPDNVSALNNAGSSYNMLGDRMNAAIYFARAYTLDPKYIEVGANLVATYLQSDPEERIPMLEIIRNVQQPELLNQIGLNLARQGHLEDAISHFNIALFQDPGSSRTHSLIGKAYAASGNSVKGAEHFKKSIELNPNNAATFNDWGILEARSGNMRRAEKLFSRAVELDSAFSEAKENLSRARQQI